MRKGYDAKEDYGYERFGGVNIFIDIEPPDRKRFVRVKSRKTKKY